MNLYRNPILYTLGALTYIFRIPTFSYSVLLKFIAIGYTFMFLNITINNMYLNITFSDITRGIFLLNCELTCTDTFSIQLK